MVSVLRFFRRGWRASFLPKRAMVCVVRASSLPEQLKRFVSSGTYGVPCSPAFEKRFVSFRSRTWYPRFVAFFPKYCMIVEALSFSSRSVLRASSLSGQLKRFSLFLKVDIWEIFSWHIFSPFKVGKHDFYIACIAKTCFWVDLWSDHDCLYQWYILVASFDFIWITGNMHLKAWVDTLQAYVLKKQCL